MLEFLNLNPQIFGIDVSDLSLKIIKLKKNGGRLKLASFCKKDIEPGLIREGEIRDEKKVAQIIREAVNNVEGEKLNTKYLVASLPEEKSFLQVIQMPSVSLKDLDSAIIFEAENYIPLPIETVYLGYQILPFLPEKKIDHIDVLLAALPKNLSESYLSCFKSAGLEPVAFETESLAISRAVMKEETSKPVLLVDLGAETTRFIIFSNQSIRFASSISVSSRNFTEAILKNMKISWQEAEELKRKYGLEEKVKLKLNGNGFEKKEERGKIFESLLPPLIDLVRQIRAHLDYYQTHSEHEHGAGGSGMISKIILCGGGSNLQGLPDFLSLELRVPVELANPLAGIVQTENMGSKTKNFLIPGKESLGFTTAIGLAMGGVEENI